MGTVLVPCLCPEQNGVDTRPILGQCGIDIYLNEKGTWAHLPDCGLDSV